MNGERQLPLGPDADSNSANMVQISRDPTGGDARHECDQGLLGLHERAARSRRPGTRDDGLGRYAERGHQVQVQADRRVGGGSSGAVDGTRSRPAWRSCRLGPDLEFEQLAFSPADMLLLDAQQFNAQVIATAYGIPAQLVNLPLEGGLNYQTPILALEQWWRTELRTTAARVCGGRCRRSCSPAGQWVDLRRPRVPGADLLRARGGVRRPRRRTGAVSAGGVAGGRARTCRRRSSRRRSPT